MNNPVKIWAKDPSRDFAKEDIQIDNRYIVNHEGNSSKEHNEINYLTFVRMPVEIRMCVCVCVCVCNKSW
jgi:hypothetical protein